MTYRARVGAQRFVTETKPATNSPKSSPISTIIFDNTDAASKQDALALAAMPKAMMLTAVSTALFPLTYETANDNFDLTSSGGGDEYVDETIDINKIIRNARPERILPRTEKEQKQAFVIVTPDGP